MIENVLLPDELKLCLEKVEIGEESIILSVSSSNPTSLCPCCGIPSDHVHSYYQRCPGDLPLVGFAVRLDMNVRTGIFWVRKQYSFKARRQKIVHLKSVKFLS
jgi:transposase